MAIKTPAKYRQMEFRTLLVELIKLLKPKVYIELGIKKCYTFNAIAPLVEKAIGIDINPDSAKYMGYTDFTNIGKPCYFYNPEKNTIFFHGNSNQFLEHCKDFKLKTDFLFIDADHNFKSILNDLFNMKRFLIPYKSLVFIHDTYPIKEELAVEGYCHNAWRAARIIRRRHDIEFEIITLPGPWAGLSILRYAPCYHHGWMDKNDITQEGGF